MSFFRHSIIRRHYSFALFIIIILFLFILSPGFIIRRGANAVAAAIDQEDASSSPLSPSGFWLSTEVLAVVFHKGCLSTALCHQPAFKLVHTMTLNGQKSAMSWPVDGGGGGELLQDGQLRQFVSHWTVGDPEDVSIGCQIAGTDPSFGFARVCDETSARRVFQEAMVRRTVMQQQNNNNRAKRKEDGTHSSGAAASSQLADNGRQRQQHYAQQQMVVELLGRCFNATLAVRGHLSRCPWCPDPNVHIHVVGAGAGAQSGIDGGDSDAAQQQQQLNSTDSLLLLHNIVIVALSGAVVFAFTGLCAVFVAQRRHRRKKLQNNKTAGGRKEMGAGGGGMSSTLMMISRGGKGRDKKGKGKKRAKLLSPPRAQQPLPPTAQFAPGVDGEAGGAEQQTMIVYAGASRRIAGGEEEEEEERYDTPWDNKYCLVPRHWLVVDNGAAGGGMAQPPPPVQSTDGAPTRPSCISQQFLPPAQLQRPTPYDHHLSSVMHQHQNNNNNFYDSATTKYATCANFGTGHQSIRSPMMGMLSSHNNNCNSRMAPPPNQSVHGGGGMPAGDHRAPPPISSRLPTGHPPPPPPPPPIALLSARHHTQPSLSHQQHEIAEKTATSFTSPNTSSGSTSRHDDSGLDSV